MTFCLDYKRFALMLLIFGLMFSLVGFFVLGQELDFELNSAEEENTEEENTEEETSEEETGDSEETSEDGSGEESEGDSEGEEESSDEDSGDGDEGSDDGESSDEGDDSEEEVREGEDEGSLKMNEDQNIFANETFEESAVYEMEGDEVGHIELENTESDNELDENSPIKKRELVKLGDNQNTFVVTDETGAEIVIEKEESLNEEKGAWTNYVTVSSEEHYESEIITEEDIKEAKEEDIFVYWLNSDKGTVLVNDVDYIDLDGNGLIDKVSWKIPHLSVQEFSIVVLLDEAGNDTEIVIDILNAPTNTINTSGGELSFAFNISYYDPINLECDFVIEQGSNIVYNDSVDFSGFNVSNNLSNGLYDWTLDCFDNLNSSLSDSADGSFSILVPYVPFAAFYSDETEIDEDTEIDFFVNLSWDSSVGSFGSYTIDFDDGTGVYSSGPLEGNERNDSLSHNYEDSGNYEAVLSVFLNNGSTLIKNANVNVLSVGDKSSPDVDLIEPEHDAILTDDILTFTYKVSDESHVDNCTYNLYYFNESSIGKLVYNTSWFDVERDVDISTQLEDFDEGDYSWEIECYDNETNYGFEDRDFFYSIDGEEQEIHSSSSSSGSSSSDSRAELSEEEKEEIDLLVEKINAFLIAVGNYGPDERDAVEDLGIVDDLKFYKKKLVSSQLDLQHNLKYIREEDQREERRTEILDEIEFIRENIPANVLVLEKNEFTKNSIGVELEEILKKYVEFNNFILSRSAMNNFIKENSLAQDKLKSVVIAKHLKIEYDDRDSEITVVSKKISVEEDFDRYMEIIPSELASLDDVTFINEVREIDSSGVVDMDIDDLEDDKVIYYIERLVNLEDIESTDTVALIEEVDDKGIGGVNAFAVFVGEGSGRGLWFYISWIFVAGFVIYSIYIGARNVRIKKWKRSTEFRELIRNGKSAREALEINDVDKAKDCYYKIQELYPLVPGNSRAYVNKKVMKVRKGIDKRDAQMITEECVKAIKEGRREDALLMYEDIQEIYSRLPRKFKDKLFRKLGPYIDLLR